MAEPVLRLVLPEMEDDRDQAPPWRATTTATNGATTGATSPATSPEARATSPAAGGATSPATKTAAGPAPEAAGDPDAVLELEPVGRPMTAGERAARLARHW